MHSDCPLPLLPAADGDANAPTARQATPATTATVNHTRTPGLLSLDAPASAGSLIQRPPAIKRRTAMSPGLQSRRQHPRRRKADRLVPSLSRSRSNDETEEVTMKATFTGIAAAVVIAVGAVAPVAGATTVL